MKMRYLNYIRCAAVVLLVSTFASCGDDELNSSELKIYVNTGLQNQVEIALVQTPIGAIGESTVEFPVRSTRELLVDAQVSFTVEEALAESYNETNKTAYKLLTSDLYELTVAKTTIKQKEQISQDPIRIELTHPGKLTAEEGYILPVRMDEISSADKGLEVSTNMNTVYITITSSFTNVKAEQKAPEGTLIDKTDWTATAEKVYGKYVAANLIDDNPSTNWFGQGTPNLTFDMGTEQTIKGLRLTPDHVNFHKLYNMTDLEVLASKDGEKWEKQGALSFPSPSSGDVDNPEYRYIHFYSPLAVRYFRIKVTAAPYSYTSLAEVDAYK